MAVKEFNFKRKQLELFQLSGTIKTTDTAPTYTPTKFSDQVILYANGATFRLYIYDVTNKAWRFSALT